MKYALIALGSAVLASGAIAQPPVVVTRDVPSKIVDYSDLNIWSEAGQDRLVRRIRAAATDLCIESNRTVVKITTARKACFATALNSGMNQMTLAVASRGNSKFAATSLIISAR